MSLVLYFSHALDGHLFVAEIEDIVRAGVLHAMGGGDPIPPTATTESNREASGKVKRPVPEYSSTASLPLNWPTTASTSPPTRGDWPERKTGHQTVSEIADLLMRRAEGVDIGSAVILSSRRSDNQPFIAGYQVDTCRISRDQAGLVTQSMELTIGGWKQDRAIEDVADFVGAGFEVADLQASGFVSRQLDFSARAIAITMW